MGDVVSFPILLDSDLGRELIVDCARFREGNLDEKAVRKKYKLADDIWEKLASNDVLVAAIEMKQYAEFATAAPSERKHRRW